MSIATQCPSCGTTFRVTPPQLQAQHGMVRCGRCAQVFDGFKTLTTLPEAPAANAEPQSVARDHEPLTPAPVVTPAPTTAAIVTPPSSVQAAPAVDEARIIVERPEFERPVV